MENEDFHVECDGIHVENEDFQMEFDDFHMENEDFYMECDGFHVVNEDFHMECDDFHVENDDFQAPSLNRQCSLCPRFSSRDGCFDLWQPLSFQAPPASLAAFACHPIPPPLG